MNKGKNKWWLNGGRGSGRTFRLLCEVYENKIAELQHKVDTLQGFLDHDIEYDMDKTIQELRKENAELKKELKDANEKVVHLACNQNKDLKYNLTKAKELLQRFIETSNPIYFEEDRQKVKTQAEQFLRETDIDNAIQKANEGLDLDKIADEVEEDLKDSCPDTLCEDCTKEDCTVRKLGLIEK